MIGTFLFKIGSFGVPAMGACVLVGAILAVLAIVAVILLVF